MLPMPENPPGCRSKGQEPIDRDDIEAIGILMGRIDDMLTDTQEGRKLLNEAAYAIVCQEAPDELPLYVSLRDRYLADPDGFAGAGMPEDEALGFGGVIAVQTLTEVLFPILAPILLYIVTQAAEALRDEGGKRAAEWVHGLFRTSIDVPEAQAVPEPLFMPAQLHRIRIEIAQIAEQERGRLGAGKYRVARIQDALLARLALAMA